MIDPDRIEASQLMERYCGGDVVAFHRLYALVAPRMLSYLRALSGDRASAEDLLAQTFLRLHRTRSSYVRNADPIPWIYDIARNTCFHELRRRASRVNKQDGRSQAATARGVHGTTNALKLHVHRAYLTFRAILARR